MKGTLEQRYRAALRWYPKKWRLANEDVVLGTLLDHAEAEGLTAPRPAELINLAIHGVAQRARMLPSTIPASIRARTSTAALAVGAAIALGAALQLESPPERYMEFFGREYATFGPFTSPAIIIYAVWIVALLAAVAGRATAARWMIAATIPLTIAVRLFADASDMFLRPTWTFLGVLLLLSALVVAGSPSLGNTGDRRLMAWFLPTLLAIVLPQLIIDREWTPVQEPMWLDRPDILIWAPVMSACAAAALQLTGHRSWAFAAALVGVPFAAATLFGGDIGLEASMSALMLATGTVAGALVVRGFIDRHGFAVWGVTRRPSRAGHSCVPAHR